MPRINPIGNEWNPPAARFGPTPAPAPGPAPAPPPAPAENVLFWARFETVQKNDEVGNWIYVLDEWVSPGDTFVIDTTTGGEPGSPIGSMDKTAGGRRFYIQAADNETGGTTALASSTDFDGWDFEYSIYFRLPSSGQTNINLGGFNPGGGDGQAIFSLNLYWFGGAPELEARIDRSTGAFYLNGGVLTLANLTWYRARIRRTADLFELLLDDTVIASSTQTMTFTGPTPLVSFGVDKHYPGTRTGWFDEPKLTYSPQA